MKRLTLDDLLGVPVNEALLLYYTQARHGQEEAIETMKTFGMDVTDARRHLARIEEEIAKMTALLPEPAGA